VGTVLRELDAELASNHQFREIGSGSPGGRTVLDFVMLQLSKINWAIMLPILVLGIGALVFVVVYRVWATHRSQDPLSKLGPGIYRPLSTNSGELLPLSPSQNPPRN
jgi:hypothetical protein